MLKRIPDKLICMEGRLIQTLKEAARNSLLQVEKCAPGDAEVRELLARIGER